MSDLQSTPPEDSVGTVLARARQARGLKLEDAGLALKLTAARVAALEADQFSSVGPAVFVRGFVRSYARLLDLPERGFDAALQRYFDQLEPELVPSVGTRRSASWAERYSGAFSYLVGTALVLTLIWTVIGFDADNQKRSRAASEVQESSGPAPAEQIAATASEQDRLFAAGLEGQATPPPVDSAPAVEAPSAPVLASLSPFADDIAADRGFRLELSGQSWTEVLDAAGNRIAYGTLDVGSHRIEGQPPFIVLLGNAGAARITAAGQSIDVTPFMRANVARFKLEASDGALRATVAAPR